MYLFTSLLVSLKFLLQYHFSSLYWEGYYLFNGPHQDRQTCCSWSSISYRTAGNWLLVLLVVDVEIVVRRKDTGRCRRSETGEKIKFKLPIVFIIWV